MNIVSHCKNCIVIFFLLLHPHLGAFILSYRQESARKHKEVIEDSFSLVSETAHAAGLEKRFLIPFQDPAEPEKIKEYVLEPQASIEVGNMIYLLECPDWERAQIAEGGFCKSRRIVHRIWGCKPGAIIDIMDLKKSISAFTCFYDNFYEQPKAF